MILHKLALVLPLEANHFTEGRNDGEEKLTMDSVPKHQTVTEDEGGMEAERTTRCRPGLCGALKRDKDTPKAR